MARGRQSLEEALAALKALGDGPIDAAATERLRAAIAHRSAPVVAKAAAVVAEAGADELVPDLVAAFERLMEHAVKRDPGCLGKAAIVRALHQLDCADCDLYLVAARHVQLEPVYGGRADTALDLRSAAALGLVRARYAGLLNVLAEMLADPQAPVRAAAARALAYHGQASGAALLRLRVLAGDGDPQVLGDCMAAVIAIEGDDGVAFVARFLEAADPIVFDVAVFALGESRAPAALDALRCGYEGASDPDRRQSVLTAIATLRTDPALDWLIQCVATADGECARGAIEALSLYRHDAALRARVVSAAAREDIDLSRAVADAF